MPNKDKFAELFDDPKPNPRFENWLFHTLRDDGFDALSAGTRDFRTAMADYIQTSSYEIASIKPTYAFAVVHEELLKWVGDDPWQHRWIAKQLFGARLFPKPNLASRDKTILLIDVWRPGSEDKTAAVESLKKNWLMQDANDKKYRRFFDKDKELKFAMLTDWVSKNNQPLRLSPGQQEQPLAQQFYELADVLEFFYQRSKHNKNDAKVCFDDIKKRWSQTKYRDGLKGEKKKQCNLILPDKTLKQLDEMADKYLVKRTQILEVLIRFEAEQKHYLPAWIKRLDTDHLDEGTTLSSSK